MLITDGPIFPIAGIYLGWWELWEEKWMVITMDHILFYNSQNAYISNETEFEKFALSQVKQILSCDEKIFEIYMEGDSHQFRAKSHSSKLQWMKDIEKCRHKHIKIPIAVHCPRNHEFNNNFQLVKPYNGKYEYYIKDLLTDIMEIHGQYHDKKYQFVPFEIRASSFIGQQIHYADYDWNHTFATITDYPQDVIEKFGIELDIDLEKYQHKPMTFDAKCEKMRDDNNLCPIYAKMRYQDLFSEQDLNHLYEYGHDTTDCKFGDECYAFKRVEQGGNKLADRCHVMIYKHPPRGGIRAREKELGQGINSFCLNDEFAENEPLHYPAEEDKIDYGWDKRINIEWSEKNGFLRSLMDEVIVNGYKTDLCKVCPNGYNLECKHDDYSIMEIVDNKLQCMRHKLMGSPLNRAEMLSIILYTAGNSNYDLCKSQRNGDYHKWKWMDYCLYHAIHKLSKREYASYKIYTGLGGTKLNNKYIDCGYFKTYVSTSWMRSIAETFADDEGMIFVINEKFRAKAICCDVSWISKFGISECEILIARSIDAVFNRFQCKVIDERNGIQIASLKLYDKIQESEPESNSINRIQPERKEMSIDPPNQFVVKTQNNGMYGSYLAVTKLGEIMQEIDENQQSIARTFILPLQRKLNCIIPTEIFCLICASFRYEFGSKKSEFIQDKCEGLSFKDATTISTVESASIAIYNIPIYIHPDNSYNHTWMISFEQMSSAIRLSSKATITFGIQPKNTRFPVGFYGFDNNGTMYKQGQIIGKSIFTIITGDIIILTYDSLNKNKNIGRVKRKSDK